MKFLTGWPRCALPFLRRFGLFALVVVGLPLWLLAAGPSWWAERGMLVSNSGPDDFALVNQGQLKHAALTAFHEFENTFDEGAGPAITALVDQWSQLDDQNQRVARVSAGTLDFDSVNLGQLKAAAQPFHDRLRELKAVGSYPWTSTPEDDDDFARANIGQLKEAFNFEPAAAVPSAAPGDLQLVINEDGSSDLSWTPGTAEATAQDVERSADGGATWTVLASVGATANTVRDADALTGPAYQYRVTATHADGTASSSQSAAGNPDGDDDSDGTSNAAELLAGTNPNSLDTDGDGMADSWDPNPRVANPKAPRFLEIRPTDLAKYDAGEITIRELDHSKVDLTWDLVQAGVTQLLIEKRISTGPWKELARVGPGERKFQESGLLANQNYYYRLSAINKVGVESAPSLPVEATHVVPFYVALAMSYSQLQSSQPGFRAYLKTGNLWNFYLQQTVTNHSSYKLDSTPTTEYSSAVNDLETSDSYRVEIKNPAAHTSSVESGYTYRKTEHVLYPSGAVSDSLSKVDGIYHWLNSGRRKTPVKLVASILADATSRTSYVYNGNGQPTSASSEGFDRIYQSEALLTAVPPPPFWKGTDYNLAAGTLTWTGTSTANSDFKGYVTTSRTGRATSTPNSANQWTGSDVFTSVDIHGTPTVTTSSPRFPVWSGANPWSVPNTALNQNPLISGTSKNFHRDSTATDTTDRSIYYKTYADLDTYQLDQPYPAQAFMTDVMADLPDWSPLVENYYGWTWSSHGGWGAWNAPWNGWWQAGRDLSLDQETFFIARSKYQIQTSSTVPRKAEWYEVFIPEEDPATEQKESEQHVVIRSWSLPAETGSKFFPPEAAELDPSLRSDGDGHYYLAWPAQLNAASGYSILLDQKERNLQGLSFQETYTSPGWDNDGNPLPPQGPFLQTNFWLTPAHVLGSRYQFRWEGDAITLLVNGIYDPVTDSYGQREIHSGDYLTYAELQQSSLELIFRADPAKMTSPFAEISLLSTDSAGNSLGSDFLKAKFIPIMQVDANRDGLLSFASAAQIAQDQTNASRPYCFWLNNDHDIYHRVDGNDTEFDDANDSGKDCNYPAIFNVRDLEDFSRLRISFKGLTNLVKDPQYTVTLEWRSLTGGKINPLIDGTPEIKLYEEREPSERPLYLESRDVATNQCSEPFNQWVGSVSSTLPQNLFRFRPERKAALTEDSPVLNMLFCGVQAGRGQIVIVIKKGDELVGEFPGIHLELHDIKDLYERWTVGDGSGAIPALLPVLSKRSLARGLRFGRSRPFAYSVNDRDENRYILYVHGWNMLPAEKDQFAETAYKRLFWQGYKGRFGAFQWPTTFNFGATFTDNTVFKTTLNGVIGAKFDPTNYDRGEWSAWRSASGLKHLLLRLSAYYPGQVYMFAHSMGNVVAGEALRLAAKENRGVVVNTYIASQAALPSHCYDGTRSGDLVAILPLTTSPLPSFDHVNYPETPNVYPDWLASNRASVGRRVNFFNTNDYALWNDCWQLNQYLKPDHFSYFHLKDTYFYSGLDLSHLEEKFYKIARGRITGLQLGSQDAVKDRYEIMAFDAESRSKALGATPDMANFGGVSVDLQKIWEKNAPDNGPKGSGGQIYGAHKWHSAQFRSTNMRQKDYWRALLDSRGFNIIN